MRRLLPLLLLLLPPAAIADAGGAGAPLPDAPVRRFAVVVGNDTGGEGTRPLRYATSDARRVADTLTRLGRTAPRDLQVLLDRGARDLVDALAAAERGVSASRALGQRTELIVYYSGHAKDGSLRLGDTHFPLDSLKGRLASSGADVRIAMLDACRSGAITRTKGARRAPAFAVDRGPADARGVVILTSSANDEDSQESDALTGSFFTTALVSGMLGEADTSGDRRVSLAEAYAYAYDRTVAGTVETAAGTQHPTFHFDLAGHGDVVLTDLRGPALSFLVLPAQLAGTWVVVDDATRTVAAELEKAAGAERRMALAPGRYLVKTRRPDHLEVASVTVPARGEARLDPGSLRPVPFSDDPIKGALAPLLSPMPRWSVRAGGGWRLAVGAPDRFTFPDVAMAGLELGLSDYLRPGWTLGVDFTFGRGGGQAQVGLPLDFTYQETSAGVSLTADLTSGPLRPSVGARVGMLWMSRDFPAELGLSPQRLTTTVPGLQVGLSWNVTPAVSLYSRARGGYAVLDPEDGASVLLLDLTAGMGWSFR